LSQVQALDDCSMYLTLSSSTVSPNSTVMAEAVISCEDLMPSGKVTFSIAPYGIRRPTPIPMEAIIAPPSPSPASPIYYQNVLCTTNVAGAGYTATASCTFRASSEPGNYVVTATYMGVGGTLTSSANLTVTWPSPPTTTTQPPTSTTTTTTSTSTQPTATATKSSLGTLALPIALAGVLGVIVVAAAHSAKKG